MNFRAIEGNKNSNFFKLFETKESNFQDKNNISINKNNKLDEEKSTEAFNEWYKSFYDTRDIITNIALKTPYSYGNFANKAKENLRCKFPTANQTLYYPSACFDSKADIEAENYNKLRNQTDLDMENTHKLSVKWVTPNINKPLLALNDSSSAGIHCLSYNFSILDSEKSPNLSNFSNDPNLSRQYAQSQSNCNRINKESSIIAKSNKQSLNQQQNRLAITCKEMETATKAFNQANTNTVDFVTNIDNTSSKTDFNFNINKNTNCELQKTNSNKNMILNLDKFKFKTEKNKLKSTREVFLANLTQFKINQSNENMHFIAEIENYVRSIEEKEDKNLENEDNIVAAKNKENQQQAEGTYSHKYSLKELQAFQNKRQDREKHLCNMAHSAKGRFIRNFLCSNDSFDLENLLIEKKINLAQKDYLNNLPSPNKFLTELIEIQRNIRQSSACVKYKTLIGEDQNVIAKNPCNQISLEELYTVAINSMKRKEEQQEEEGEKKEKEESKLIIEKKKENLDDNFNFEIDVLSMGDQSEKEDFNSNTHNSNISYNNLSGKKSEQNITFLCRKNKFNVEKKTKNFRKKGFKYKMFSKEDKEFCLSLLKIFDYDAVAKFCNIPIKSLKRWAIIGSERKRGGGRKTRDPEMETLLIKWINERIKKQENFDIKMIKAKALEYTINESFMASKGWFNKFQKKYKFEIPNVKKQNKTNLNTNQNNNTLSE